MELPSPSTRSAGPHLKPRILCVDDEAYVLESLRDRLHRSFDVRVAGGGVDGLALLRQEPEAYAIIISDMRMPGMPGDAFLREARMAAPDATRILLTGHADMDAAVRAVNHAQLFRFLTKPCEPDELLRACAAALGHHRLVTAERVLLEQTLHQCIDALVRTLALASPAAFGRGLRLKRQVSALAAAAKLANPWEVEMAAMLVNIGAVTLPPAIAEKWYSGTTLSTEESLMVKRVPTVSRELLGRIPRLDGVLEILDAYRTKPEPGNPLSIGAVPEPARILRIAIDFDELESAGDEPDVALSTMRARRIYDPYLLTQLGDSLGCDDRALGAVRSVRFDELELGMTLADDVRTTTGKLLVARGHVVDQGLLDRLGQQADVTIRTPLRVHETDDPSG